MTLCRFFATQKKSEKQNEHNWLSRQGEAEVPIHYSDPAEAGVATFDQMARRPADLPLPDSDSDYESVAGEPDMQRRLGDRALQMAGAASGHLGQAASHVGQTFARNVVGTAHIMHAGAQAAGAVAAHLGTSVGGATASIIEPGSVARRTVGAAAMASHSLMEAAGPPIVHGGYLAAEAAKEVAKGAAGVATNHVLPALQSGAGLAAHATVNHVLPAMQVGMGHAAHATVHHVLPAAHSVATAGASLLRELLGRASLTAGDIIRALDSSASGGGGLALENGGSLQDAPRGRFRVSRSSTPPPRVRKAPAAMPASASHEKPEYETSFDTPAEWLAHHSNGGRGYLVEQIYKRPRWRELLQVDPIQAQGQELRKKLLKLSPGDLAAILVHLDHM